jgi:hypothetical protein
MVRADVLANIGANFVRQIEQSVGRLQILTESLILAQNERWRRG